MNQQLWDQEILDNLNSEIPETAPYLERVGYIQNNILRMQEILRAEETQPDWMDSLAIQPRDLMDPPGAWRVVQFLHGRQIPVAGVWEIPVLAEIRDEEYQELLSYDETAQKWEAESRLLEDRSFNVSSKRNEAILESTDVRDQLVGWASTVVENHTPRAAKPNWSQALLITKLIMFLDQEAGTTPGWGRESILSLLSEPFYEKAGNLPAQN